MSVALKFQNNCMQGGRIQMYRVKRNFGGHAPIFSALELTLASPLPIHPCNTAMAMYSYPFKLMPFYYSN